MSRKTKSKLTKLMKEDKDLLQAIVQSTLQEILLAEMDEHLGAGRYERGDERRGYRSGYYKRSLITRVGKIELRVPQDRDGKFSTVLFDRYQRSEKALVLAMMTMYVKGVSTPDGAHDSPFGLEAIASWISSSRPRQRAGCLQDRAGDLKSRSVSGLAACGCR